MSLQTLTNLLAEDDWRKLLGPLVVFGIYALGSILKAASARKTNTDLPKKAVQNPSQQDQDIDDKPRYKPLGDAAGSARTPQQRTLPYARPSGQPQYQPTKPQVAPVTGQQIEWDRQQRLKQIENARRQQLAQQQAAQAAAAKTLSSVRAVPRVPPQKTPQEKLQQVYVAQPQTAIPRPASVPPQPKKPSAPASVHKSPSPTKAVDLQRLLRQRNTIRTVMVLKEILDKPLALR